jgi:hypothetical protein
MAYCFKNVKLCKSTFEIGSLSIELFHPTLNEKGNVMVVASHPINSKQKTPKNLQINHFFVIKTWHIVSNL